MSLDDPNRSLPSSPDWVRIPQPDTPAPLPTLEPRVPAPRRNRPLLHVFLFLATVITTMYAGSLHYAGFESNFADSVASISFTQGAWYSFTILAILGSHELGHYFACRYHGVDASLPYFLPAPLPFTGTVGAVIRIRQMIPSKRMLFDIGAAGPIAGFAVAVPALFVGLWLSRVVPMQTTEDSLILTLGEPLLFQLAAGIIWGDVPIGYSLNLHPVGLAAWLGMLVTVLNLFPIAQLDGGHISYAALGSRSTKVTLGAVLAVIGLTFNSASWIIWSVLVVLMIVFLGPRHPRTLDDHVPLDRTRRWVALGTVAIFVLCFTPAPIEVMDLLTQP